MNRTQPLRVGIIGAATASSEVIGTAYEMGRLIAENGGVVITGGRTGVMEAASQGAQTAHGITIGILPGTDELDANAYVMIPIATGLGHARNAVITQSASVVIAISGGYGTLSEIALALKMGKDVYGLNTWNHIDGVIYAESPKEICEKIFGHASR